MLKIMIFGAGLTMGAMGLAHAAPLSVPAPTGSASMLLVGEGCGANLWRDRNGNCHPFGGPGGSNRGTRYECPPGTHIGSHGGACWPNR